MWFASQSFGLKGARKVSGCHRSSQVFSYFRREDTVRTVAAAAVDVLTWRALPKTPTSPHVPNLLLPPTPTCFSGCSQEATGQHLAQLTPVSVEIKALLEQEILL
ncbi:unnamed protein product [Ectocarpus sp. 8 AP-2014]